MFNKSQVQFILPTDQFPLQTPFQENADDCYETQLDLTPCVVWFLRVSVAFELELS